MANENTMMKINELDDSELLIIRQQRQGGGWKRTVKAPLPDGFGMSVGSSFTDPQNIDLAAQGGGSRFGSLATGALTAAARLTGMSTKITQHSNVFYAGPEPTEVSFEMTFNSYYSAYDEVVVPAASLMMMSVGSEIPLADLDPLIAKALRSVKSESRGNEGFFEGLGFIKSAGKCKVSFGTTMTIPDAYVSSVGVKFSNVLDNQGYPTSADCSVTIKVVRNPTQLEVGANYFTDGGIK